MPKKKKEKKTGGPVIRPSHLSDSDRLHITNLLKLMARAKFSEISMEEIAACMSTYAKVQELLDRSKMVKAVKPKAELTSGKSN